MKRIKYLVMDVDGTLTDGKIYIGQEGEIAKAFDIKDGCGILITLPKYGIIPVIITARKSKILEIRCAEIGIKELHQGVIKKLDKMQEIIGEDFSSVAYVGDDLPDIPCMEAVKTAGGFVFCPADAISEIKALADYVSGFKAGEGAIRDCINYLIHMNEDHKIYEKVNNVIDRIISGKNFEKVCGMLSEDCRYTIQEYWTKKKDECVIETHRRHIDIQYMIEGREELVVYNTDCLTATGIYNEETDVEYWHNGIEASKCLLVPGSLVVIYNNHPHKGGIKLNQSEYVKKLVFKIEI